MRTASCLSDQVTQDELSRIPEAGSVGINGRRGAGLAVGEDVGQGNSPEELDPVHASPRLGLSEIEGPICLDGDADNLDTGSARRPNTLTESTYTCRQRRS